MKKRLLASFRKSALTLNTALVLFGASALPLSGCSSLRVIDNDVVSYSYLKDTPQPPTYSIDRLPSQKEESPQREMLERLATQALESVGMQRDDAHGNLRLELFGSKRSHIPNMPYYDDGFSFGYSPWGFNPYFGYYGSWRNVPPTQYVYDVRLVLRDAKGKVVYETSAHYDDIWLNDELIFRLLLQSALDGFPTPPQGARRIRLQVQP